MVNRKRKTKRCLKNTQEKKHWKNTAFKLSSGNNSNRKITLMKVQDIIQVTGRGTIFIVDLKENGYTTEKYIKEIPIKVGTNVVHDGETYIVTGVEVQSYERGYNSTIGLNVRKL